MTAGLLALLSCSKDAVFDRARTSADIMEVYYSSALLKDINANEGVYDISFTDGRHIILPFAEVRDVKRSSLPKLTVQDGVWYCDGTTTSVSNQPDIGNKKALLVCLAYDYHNVYLFLSNGNLLHIPDSDDGALTCFSFRTQENPALKEDVSCNVENQKITATLPVGLIGIGLCPVYLFRGKSLTVGGVSQTSGLNTQKFSSPVEYVAELTGGKIVVYSVELYEHYPTVRITTQGYVPINSKDNYVSATMILEDYGHVYWDQDRCVSEMKIRGRGNSTWFRFPKKPYRIKLVDKLGIFGLPKNKDWDLLANYSDKSLLRNATAMEISRICSMSWTPSSLNVDVYLNNDYIGSYDLVEHKEVAKNKVNIDTANDSFYLEIEAQKDNPVCFDTGMKIPVMFSDPENPTPEQKEYIINYFKEFENSLVSPDFADPLNGYAKYIDVESFINHYIVQELTKNIDADLFKSLFLTKEKDGKLKFYHVWDFDLALGNCDYFGGHPGMNTSYTGWYIRNYTQEGPNTGWYYCLFKDPAFEAKVKARWNELYPRLCQVPSFIETQYARISGSAGRNFVRWDILGRDVWPNVCYLGDYRLEVDYLKDFYANRLHWMNREIANWQ